MSPIACFVLSFDRWLICDAHSFCKAKMRTNTKIGILRGYPTNGYPKCRLAGPSRLSFEPSISAG